MNNNKNDNNNISIGNWLDAFYRPDIQNTKSSLCEVSSPIKLETLSKDKPHNRHSPERYRTQPEHLSIDQYTLAIALNFNL